MNENKHKVATFTSGLDSKMKKITNCLNGYQEGLTPKQISLKTGINQNTVKSILPKMKNIIKINRGLYKVESRGDSTRSFPLELKSWNFHNCIMTLDDASPNFSKILKYGLVSLNINVSSSGKATCIISTDWPLNVSSLSMVADMFAELFGKTSKDVMIRTIEFNQDYSNLRLDGVNSISVDNLITQFKVYQKKRGMRIEHKTKVPMTVDNVVAMLSSTPSTTEVNVKLSQQKELIERLTVAVETSTQMLFKLADRVGERR